VISALVVFIVGFPIFLWVETKATRPIMPLSIIASSPRANIVFGNALGAVIVNCKSRLESSVTRLMLINTAAIFNAPIFFQAVLLESATQSGIRLILPSLAASIAGVSTGFLITWSKRLKWPLVTGSILQLVGTAGLALNRKGLPDWIYLILLVPSNVGQGFLFPGSFIALLSVSEQAEQAVVTSTLILWRSLGMVLGVATSSLVLQNSLVYYLEMFVSGPDKAEVSFLRPSHTLLWEYLLIIIGYFQCPKIRCCNWEIGFAISGTGCRFV
jgi:hypothetical protein